MPDLKKKGNSFIATLNPNSSAYSTLTGHRGELDLGSKSFVEDTTLQKFYTNCFRTEDEKA
ncbi:hypothetical protein [Leptospira haakeii]|uniref:Uncharacterized protein n=1 Tax=Leptospira haakeii TaxID=2023198 RepID=A0ABX4PGT0_9LEPT|nr:hypothetical protein [Leptospira haakeii]PKA14991.1 hypothetical protein CH363_15525 [Leptospira haakeii]PKA18991.1 hypothetical protein CH377_14305 [Leptospira haakeii]